MCDHERGDDPYNTWVWTFSPARSGRPAGETVFACGGDAGHTLWQRDLIGPDPWRVLAEDPPGSPMARTIRYLGLRGASLPTPRTCSHRAFRLAR